MLLPLTAATAKADSQPGDGVVAMDAGLVLRAEGRPPLPSGSPRTIDSAAWKSCVSLATAVVDLVDATGINATMGQTQVPTILQPTLDDIAATRRAIAALDNAAGVHHRNVVSQVGNNCQVVGDVQSCYSVIHGELPDGLEHVFLC